MDETAPPSEAANDQLPRELRLWLRTRRLITVGVLALIALVIIADQRGWLLVPRADDLTAYHGAEARVIRVIDGDTLEIDLPDAREQRPATRITLWGVACPLPAAAGRESAPLAAEATGFTRSLVQGNRIRLRIEPQRTRNGAGDLLAHVETLDARSLNEALLEEGLARVDERWPHSLLLRYAQLETNARRLERGQWKEQAE